MQKSKQTKSKGNIFTPDWIVDAMLSIGHYDVHHDILCKHVIDNSCGDGRFLVKIVSIYCEKYENEHDMDIDENLTCLRNELSTYIHGIEIDNDNYKACISNLDNAVSKYNFNEPVVWNIVNDNALAVTEFDNRMDYIFINPPYVRIHNMDEETQKELGNYSFVTKGMSDLYLAFFELSFKQAKDEYSTVCTITPDSWLTSEAGGVMREYVLEHLNFVNAYDFENVQPFKNATTYPIISLFIKDKHEHGGIPSLLNRIYYDGKSYNISSVSEMFKIRNDKFYFDDGKKKVRHNNRKLNTIHVKNGFATLADKVFISKFFTFKSGTINVCKATTGEWYDCIFPYVNFIGETLLVTENFLHEHAPEAYSHLSYYKYELMRRNIDDKTTWYTFGRTQAINDLWKPKYAVSHIIKSFDNIKITYVESGKGVFGGLYVVADKPITEELLSSVLKTDKFFDYVKSLRHHKSGGYYSFSSKELEDYLNQEINR